MTSGKNKPRAVLDTNVYISALLFGGIPAQVIDLAREKKILILTSSNILFELAGVLQDKFKFQRKMILDVIAEIKRYSAVIFVKTKIYSIKEDPADNMILECAVEGKADYIVTGDKKHIRPLNHYKGISIKLPREFIKEINL
ncbi:MAG: putative toxin-antitoxin system toxin component, PIN family [Candidatus Margulisiibacteriota bacterium]